MPAAESLTPAQARMARAALHWSLDEVAAAVGVSRRTILRLENDQRDIVPAKVAAIRKGYEDWVFAFSTKARVPAVSFR